MIHMGRSGSCESYMCAVNHFQQVRTVIAGTTYVAKRHSHSQSALLVGDMIEREMSAKSTCFDDLRAPVLLVPPHINPEVDSAVTDERAIINTEEYSRWHTVMPMVSSGLRDSEGRA